jgi:hypothetical protein
MAKRVMRMLGEIRIKTVTASEIFISCYPAQVKHSFGKMSSGIFKNRGNCLVAIPAARRF